MPKASHTLSTSQVKLCNVNIQIVGVQRLVIGAHVSFSLGEHTREYPAFEQVKCFKTDP